MRNDYTDHSAIYAYDHASITFLTLLILGQSKEVPSGCGINRVRAFDGQLTSSSEPGPTTHSLWERKFTSYPFS